MKRKADFMMENVGGEYLIVPLGAQVMDMNGIITLNATGAHLWELLEAWGVCVAVQSGFAA